MQTAGEGARESFFYHKCTNRTSTPRTQPQSGSVRTIVQIYSECQICSKMPQNLKNTHFEIRARFHA